MRNVPDNCARATLRFMDEVDKLNLNLFGVDNIPSGLDRFVNACKVEPFENNFVKRLFIVIQLP